MRGYIAHKSTNITHMDLSTDVRARSVLMSIVIVHISSYFFLFEPNALWLRFWGRYVCIKNLMTQKSIRTIIT